MANEVEAQFFGEMGLRMRENLQVMMGMGYLHPTSGGSWNTNTFRQRADQLMIQYMLYAIPAGKPALYTDYPRLIVRDDYEVIACDRDTRGRVTSGEVRLARYLPSEKVWLLNGDGFDEQAHRTMQTWFRDQCRAAYPEANIIIPFQALSSAGMNFDSIRIIDVTEDFEGWENHPVPDVPVLEEERWNEGMNGVRLEEGSRGFHERATNWRNWIIHTGERQYRVMLPPTEGSYSDYHARWWVWANLLRGAGPADWQELLQGHLRQDEETGMLEETTHVADPDTGQQWYWRERVHRLGASVFSAEDTGTGKRHRWVSAFDQNEPDALYYLAQLPDKGKVADYEQALDLLAPPLVHEARAAGLRVDRQGDVFAVETDLTDEQVYERAKWRVRRQVALWMPSLSNFQAIQEGMMTEPQPADGEVVEKIDCPCGCGNKRRVGYGPVARRTLMIHGTAHTATEVVVCDKGVTLIKGTMHHDPQLTEPGRARDHIDRQLAEGRWYIAVRNTVPAMDSRQAQVTEPLVERLMQRRARPRRATRETTQV